MKTLPGNCRRFDLNCSLPQRIFYGTLAFASAVQGLTYGQGDLSGIYFLVCTLILTYLMTFASRISIIETPVGLRLNHALVDAPEAISIVDHLTWNEGVEYVLRSDAGWDNLMLSPAFTVDFIAKLFEPLPYLFLYSGEGLLLRTSTTAGDLKTLLTEIDLRCAQQAGRNESFFLPLARARRSEMQMCKATLHLETLTLNLPSGRLSGPASAFQLFATSRNQKGDTSRVGLSFDGVTLTEEILPGSALSRLSTQLAYRSKIIQDSE